MGYPAATPPMMTTYLRGLLACCLTCRVRHVTPVDHAGSPCLIMVRAKETMTARAAVISMRDGGSGEELGTLSAFRRGFYDCLHRRADALFEVCDAVLCADGPVGSMERTR